MSNVTYASPEFSIGNLLKQERSGELSPQQVDLLSCRHFDGLRQEMRANERSTALGILSTIEQVVITPNIADYYVSIAGDIVTEPIV